MAGGLAGGADDVDGVLDGLAGGFLRRREQRADIDVEADIGERRGDHRGAAVVAVLARFDHQHARAAALPGGEGLDVGADAGEFLVVAPGGAVDGGTILPVEGAWPPSVVPARVLP